MSGRFTLLVGFVISTLMLLYGTPASAATPPDSCLAFSSGTITDYYDNEGNNAANPVCPRDVDIPSVIGGVAVTDIGDFAFSGKDLTAVTIPSSVTTIGYGAFGYNNLTTITVPSGVATIDNVAFGNNQIISATIEGDPTITGSQTFWGNSIQTLSYNGTTYSDAQPIAESCYEINPGGTITEFHYADLNFIKANSEACLNHDLTIPSQVGGVTVVSIADYTFSNVGLHSVVIPNTVTSIQDSAFSFNEYLTSVTIPNSVTNIGYSAFNQSGLTSVSIPDSVNYIGEQAFWNNQLTSVRLPAGITTIRDYAFSDNMLTEVTIPSSVTSIGQSAFGNNQLTTLELPGGVLAIGNSAFSSNKLTSISIPSSVTSIGDWAFSGNNLTGLPANVTDIGSGVYAYNEISTLVIPAGVTSIGEYAFSHNNLTSVAIPDSVTSIGDFAFENNAIGSAYIGNGITSLSPMVFYKQVDYDRFAGDESDWNGAFGSGDPAQIKAAQEALLLVRVYTGDPADPQGLKSSLAYEGYNEIDGDGDWNDTAVVGGFIVNPANLTLNYQSSTSQNLESARIFAGQNPDGSYITNYYLSDIQNIPELADESSYHYPVITPAEQQTIDDMFARYYQIGDTVTITPPDIAGYITPGVQTFALTSAMVEEIIVYAAVSSNSPAVGDGSASDGGLADTGANLPLVVTSALVAIVAGSAVLTRRIVARA